MWSPSELDEIVGQPTDKVRESVDATVPVILHGPPGTGKTSTARVISQDYNENWNRGMDLRSVHEVRDTFQGMSRNMSLLQNELVVIDELDFVSDQGQASLREVLDDPSEPWIMTCNDLGQIIPAIKSRCRLVEYDRVSDREIADLIEQFEADDSESIVEMAAGDVRTAVQEASL